MLRNSHSRLRMSLKQSFFDNKKRLSSLKKKLNYAKLNTVPPDTLRPEGPAKHGLAEDAREGFRKREKR